MGAQVYTFVRKNLSVKLAAYNHPYARALLLSNFLILDKYASKLPSGVRIGKLDFAIFLDIMNM